LTVTTPLVHGTKQQQTLENLQSRYSIDLANVGASYIYSQNDTDAKLARTKLSEVLFQHLFNGGAKGEITLALEFLLEVAELRAIETFRPQGWNQLAEHLPTRTSSLGGE